MNKYELDWQEFTKGFNAALTKQAADNKLFGRIKGFFSKKPPVPPTPPVTNRPATPRTPSTPQTSSAGGGWKDMAKVLAMQEALGYGINKATGMFGGTHQGGGFGSGLPEGFLPNARPVNPYNTANIPHTIKLDVTPPRDILSTYEAPMSLNKTPAEMNAPLYSNIELNKAGGVSDILVKNLQAKAADKLIQQFATASKEKEHTPEEIEIITQHPEMREVLKDEKNKAYLEKLINS